MVTIRSQTRRKAVTLVSETLPMDIIFDIMLRLPVKSLLRFKSVSKTWYNLIKNPNFIKQHLTRAEKNHKPAFNSILSTVSVQKTGKQIFRVNLFDSLDKPIDLDLPFMSPHTKFTVLGISNGLVCIRMDNKSSQIFICNPLTGEFRRVPNIKGKRTYFELPIEDKESIYFGFCLNGENGYELFRMVYSLCRYGDDEMFLEGRVFSLTTNTWRKINVRKGDLYHLEDHFKACSINQTVPVFSCGVFYWAATDFDSMYVVSFDVEKEVFDVFDAAYDCNEAVWILTNLKEEVAAIIYHDDDHAFNIWVLDERDKSWELKFEIEEGYEIAELRRGSLVTVLGCAESSELVVEDYDYKDKTPELFLYDMDSGEIETLPYVNVGADRDVFLYTESLVSVRNMWPPSVAEPTV